MNQADRQQAIAEHVEMMGVCSYQDLARQFGVSEMTIRRDVDRLAGRGVVVKVLGGVQTARAPKQWYESPLYQRLSTSLAEKRQIAGEVVRRLRANQTVFLDGSSTCLVLARAIAGGSRGLTVATHSAAVCMELARSHENTILGLGGQFDPASACFVGARAEEEARRLYIDTFFFSTKGFFPQEGTFESSPATFRLKQLVAEQSARVVLLADHTKFGQRALCKVLDISQIDEVVTDAATSEDQVSLVERSGPAITVAGGKKAEAATHAP